MSDERAGEDGPPGPSPEEGLRGPRAYALFLCAALGLAALDLWTKHRAFSTIAPGEVVTVVPGFLNFILAKNFGAAFSSFWGQTHVLVGISAVAFAVLSWFSWSARGAGTGYQLTLAMIGSGVIGNVYDRLKFGFVRDFIDVYASHAGTAHWLKERFGTEHWPTFNVADACIVVGTGLLLAKMWRDERGAARAARTTPDPGGAASPAAPSVEAPVAARATERAGA
jgi:signal peptidase II